VCVCVCVYLIIFCKVHTLVRAEILDKMNDLAVDKSGTNVQGKNVMHLFDGLKRQSTNSLNAKRRPLYLKTQSVPRCKHFSSRL